MCIIGQYKLVAIYCQVSHLIKKLNPLVYPREYSSIWLKQGRRRRVLIRVCLNNNIFGDFFKRYIPQGKVCALYLIGILAFCNYVDKNNILQIMADLFLCRGYICGFWRVKIESAWCIFINFDWIFYRLRFGVISHFLKCDITHFERNRWGTDYGDWINSFLQIED